MTGTEKLDQELKQARQLLDIAMRDDTSMQKLHDLKKYVQSLEAQKREIENSVFGSYIPGKIYPSSELAKAIKVVAKPRTRDDQDIIDAARYATSFKHTAPSHFPPPTNAKMQWDTYTPVETNKTGLVISTAQGPVTVHTARHLEPYILILIVEHNGQTWFSNPQLFKAKSPTVAVHELTDYIMRESMVHVSDVIVHPKDYESLAKGVYSGRRLPSSPSMLVDDFLKDADKVMEESTTVFLKELDDIK